MTEKLDLTDKVFQDWELELIRQRYDQIPDSLLQGDILEIGGRYGCCLMSRHKERIEIANHEGRYLCIDIQRPRGGEHPLNFQQIDLFDFDGAQYDTILVLDFIEHISLYRWPEMFDKFKTMLRPGGHLFLCTLYDEHLRHFTQRFSMYGRPDVHVVYHITPEILQQFLPGAEFKVLLTRRRMRGEGESWLWAAGRTVKRLVTRSPLALRWLPRRGQFVANWRKEG